MTEIEPRISIFGIYISKTTTSQVIQKCRQWLNDTTQHYIVTANPEILLRARSDFDYKRIVNNADLVTPDGMGTCWAAAFSEKAARESRLLEIIKIFYRTLFFVIFRPSKMKSPLPERVSGSDLLWDIAKIARENDSVMYLIGGVNETSVRTAKRMRQTLPGLKIDAFAPNHIATPFVQYDLFVEIERIKPQIILVGYGSPKQEEWISQNLHRFPYVKLAMGVGGAFDFIAGNAKRAPMKFRNHGLEWFWRLFQRPSRLIRAMRATMVFPYILLFSTILRYNFSSNDK